MWGERMVNGFRREAEHKIWVVFWQVVKILFLRDCFVSKSDFHFQKARGVKFLPLYFELPCHTITFFFLKEFFAKIGIDLEILCRSPVVCLVLRTNPSSSNHLSFTDICLFGNRAKLLLVLHYRY